MNLKPKYLAVKFVADYCHIEQSAVLDALAKEYLNAAESDGTLHIINDRLAELFLENNGDTSLYRKPRIMLGEYAFVLNKIRVCHVHSGHLHTYTVTRPDNIRYAFSSPSQEEAEAQARDYATNCMEFAGRGTYSEKGLSAYLHLTYLDLTKLLAYVPAIPSNIYLIKKLEKAYKKSINKRKVQNVPKPK